MMGGCKRVGVNENSICVCVCVVVVVIVVVSVVAKDVYVIWRPTQAERDV